MSSIIVYSNDDKLNNKELILAQKRRIYVYLFIFVLCLMFLANDVLHLDNSTLNKVAIYMWIMIPGITLILTLDFIAMMDNIKKTKNTYEIIDRQCDLMGYYITAIYVSMIVRIIFLYGKNIDSYQYSLFFVVTYVTCSIITILVLKTSKRKNKSIFLIILIICILETHYINMAFSQETYKQGIVLDRNNMVYYGSYLEIDSIEKVKWYTVYRDIYKSVDVGDTVTLKKNISPWGVAITEVMVYE